MTPDDYERQAAEAEARADKLKALAELDYEQARWLRQQAAKLRRIEGGLQGRNKSRIVTGMELAQQRRRGRPAETAHPFVTALKASGSNVAEWCAPRKDCTRTAMQNYIAGRRAISRALADEIRREFKIPLTAWKRIAE